MNADGGQRPSSNTSRERSTFGGGAADGEIDIIAILRSLWAGRWQILSVMLATTFLAAVYAFMIAEQRYSASARLELDVRSQQVVDFESVISGVSTDIAAINTELEVIRSRKLIGQLVRDLDLVSDPEFNSLLRDKNTFARVKDSIKGVLGSPPVTLETLPPEEVFRRVINSVRGAVSTSSQTNTYLLEVEVNTNSAQKSADMVNGLIDIYLNDQIGNKASTTQRAADWLEVRTDELERELRQKEDEIEALRAATDLVSEEALTAMNVRAKSLRDRLQEAEAEIDSIGVQLETAELLLTEGDRTAIATVFEDMLLNRLVDGVERADSNAIAQFDQRVDELVSNMRATRTRLSAQVAPLAASYEDIRASIAEQNDDLLRINQMTREAEATKAVYESFLNRLMETSVQTGLAQADSRILSEADPGNMVAPRKTMLVALGLILGGLLGSAWVLLRELQTNTFRNAEELEDFTGQMVLSQIPQMQLRNRENLLDHIRENPTSPAAEAVRNMRTSILLSQATPPQVLLMTSSLPGEGKTTQAIMLAQNLAGMGKRVLLLEGDIRRRTLDQYFPERPDRGLLSLLSGEVDLGDVLIHSPELGTDVLLSEQTGLNTGDVFSSEAFRVLLDVLRTRYDHIIIDTPPVLLVPDARVIGTLSDAIIFSVLWDGTPRQQVLKGLREFTSVGLQVTGLVLSRVNQRRMDRYGYGYGYGSYGKDNRGYSH